MTKVKFVNHASYMLYHDNICLITDPWIEGAAFYEGWSLIEPTKLKYSGFNEITHTVYGFHMNTQTILAPPT